MRRVLKWIGIVLGVLAAVVVIAAAAVYFISESKANRQYNIAGEDFEIPTDAESIANGERLTRVRACVDCHGENLGGKLMLDDPGLGTFYTANLTSGQGGIAYFTPADWDRAIRHGVGGDGYALWIMPSYEMNGMTAEDLGDIVAYIQTLPPVDNVEPEQVAGPMGRVLVATGAIPVFAAEVVDHDQPRRNSITVEASAEYGAYLAPTCTGCHKADFAGGPGPADPPDMPPPSNLTPASDLADWSRDDFFRVMREGVRPDGSQVSEYMPWQLFGSAMTDTELEALYLYFQTVEPVENEY